MSVKERESDRERRYYTDGNPKFFYARMLLSPLESETSCARWENGAIWAIADSGPTLQSTVLEPHTEKTSNKWKTHMAKPLRKGNNLGVGILGVVKERGMAGVIPDPERKVPEVGVHERPELSAVDVLVQSAVQNEVRDGMARSHQSTLVLGVWDGPIPDIRVLTSNGTHPAVLDSLIQFIPVSDTRLGELLGSRSEISEGWIQESRDKVEDELGSDSRLHATIRERTHQDDTPEEVCTIVGGDVSGDNTSHRPANRSQSARSTAITIISETYHPAKIGCLLPIPK